MRLVQFIDGDGERRVGRVDTEDGQASVLAVWDRVLALATDAIASGRPIAELAAAADTEDTVDLRAVEADGRLLAPIDHPDSAHLIVTGTGLTHLGSADARDKMHATAEDKLTDSMRMFKEGLEGGRPRPGSVGVQPEWFYKCDGLSVAAPGTPLAMPGFALDGGEEPEIAGIYVVAPDGTPCRVGFALANEFSDHVLERRNYLLLAHSKLRPMSFGPELLLGALPADIRGTSRIRRNDMAIWEKPFLSGEANMSHSLANLEHHHFKYRAFRRPGDIHVHVFGTATLSFADGVRTEPGDVFEIEAPGFGIPLRNPLLRQEEEGLIAVRSL